MAGTKLNTATPVYENMVDIFSHSSGYFHGKILGVWIKNPGISLEFPNKGRRIKSLVFDRFS